MLHPTFCSREHPRDVMPEQGVWVTVTVGVEVGVPVLVGVPVTVGVWVMVAVAVGVLVTLLLDVGDLESPPQAARKAPRIATNTIARMACFMAKPFRDFR